MQELQKLLYSVDCYRITSCNTCMMKPELRQSRHRSASTMFPKALDWMGSPSYFPKDSLLRLVADLAMETKCLLEAEIVVIVVFVNSASTNPGDFLRQCCWLARWCIQFVMGIDTASKRRPNRSKGRAYRAEPMGPCEASCQYASTFQSPWWCIRCSNFNLCFFAKKWIQVRGNCEIQGKATSLLRLFVLSLGWQARNLY